MSIPSFATPIRTCGADPMTCHQGTTVEREREHCGGCGVEHGTLDRAVSVFIEPFRAEGSNADACVAVGRTSGHVAGYYGPDGFVVLAVSSCTREARKAATWHPCMPRDRQATAMWTQWYPTEEDRDAADAAEAYSERMYASSYGLGL